MIDYLVIAFRHPSGGWVAVLPDFIGVTGRARDMQHAVDRAAAAARGVCAIFAQIKRAMPRPCSLAAVQKDYRWAAEYGIDWEKAVIETVRMSHPNGGTRRRPKQREEGVAAPSKRVAKRVDPDTAHVAQPDQ